MDLNNRELALVIWGGIILIWVLSRPDMRAALRPVLGLFFKPVIFVPILAFAAYVGGWILLAAQFGLWQEDLMTETVFWFLVTGLVLFFAFNHVYEQNDYFARTAKRTLTAALLIEAFISFVVMPLPIELLLLPIATFLAMMSAFTEGSQEHRPAKRLVDGLLTAIGLGVLGYVAINLISDPRQLDADYGLRLLALPVWLTLASLPFIYAVGLYAAYDRAFTRIDFLADNKRSARRAKLSMIMRLHVRARRVGAFNGGWQRELVEAESPWLVIRRFLREQAAD